MFHLSWVGFIVLALVLTHTVIVLVTVYYHRAMAHRALTLSPAVNRLFRFLGWFLIGMDPQEFAAVHRKHHARCDTDEDPHSPARFGLARVVFGGLGLYWKEAANTATVETYGKGLPSDPWDPLYRRHPNAGVFLLGLMLTALWGVPGLVVWGLLMAWIPFWAAGVINGLGHAVGYRRFPTDDRSTNLVPWGVWLGGEELHNNHHADPSSPKFSTAWYEFDMGWVYIRLLQALGQATLREQPGRLAWHAAECGITPKTVHDVLRARHAWLAHLHASLTDDAREALRTHGFRRWRDLSSLWDKGADRLRGKHKVRLLNAQRHPLLSRLRAVETSLRALWAGRRASVHDTLAAWEAWVNTARSEALPRLDQFCDRITRATWQPTAA